MADQIGSDISNLMLALQTIAGKDKVTGGPQIGEDGKVVIQPYQGSSGFLGLPTRRDADNRNQALASALYALQSRNEGDLAIESLRGTNELKKQEMADIAAGLRNAQQVKGRIKEVKVKGKQDRITANNLSANTINENKEKAITELLAKYSIPASMREEFIKEVAPLLLANLAKTARHEGTALDDKGTAETFTKALQDKNLAQGFINRKTGTVEVPVNSIALIPDRFGNPLNLLQGSTTDTETYESGGMRDPKDPNKWMIPPETKTLNRMNPGSIRPLQVPVQLLQEASQQQEPKIKAGPVNPFNERNQPSFKLDTGSTNFNPSATSKSASPNELSDTKKFLTTLALVKKLYEASNPMHLPNPNFSLGNTNHQNAAFFPR